MKRSSLAGPKDVQYNVTMDIREIIINLLDTGAKTLEKMTLSRPKETWKAVTMLLSNTENDISLEVIEKLSNLLCTHLSVNVITVPMYAKTAALLTKYRTYASSNNGNNSSAATQEDDIFDFITPDEIGEAKVGAVI